MTHSKEIAENKLRIFFAKVEYSGPRIGLEDRGHRVELVSHLVVLDAQSE